MKLTNRLALPSPIVRAVANDPYDAGGADISVTRLITPPQIVALERQYAEAITEDVADRIYALLGQVGHGILERASLGDDAIFEKRFFTERLGWKISGQVDLYFPSEQLLQDYKFVSIYKMMDGVPAEYVQQFNVNALLLREAGYTVSRAEVVVIYRDWSKGQAERNAGGDYPQTQVEKYVVPLWTPEQQEAYLLERVKLHQEAQAGNPAPCTPADCWEKPAAYAVMKRGQKKAIRLCKTEAEAWQIVGNNSQLYVQYRSGRRTRCELYCKVAFVCKQWSTFRAQNDGGTNEE